VKIVGTCAPDDVEKLKPRLGWSDDFEDFHCLRNGGVCGLPNWAREKIDVVGNLAERDFDVDDIRDTLLDLADAAPSLEVKVHVGGDYEAAECVATVTLEAGGSTIGPPEIEEVPAISEEQMRGGLLAQLSGRRS
jgi:hypothetical protein